MRMGALKNAMKEKMKKNERKKQRQHRQNFALVFDAKTSFIPGKSKRAVPIYRTYY